MVTNPAPMFDPITPAVITRHLAPAMKPAAGSGTSTAHHRASSSRLSVAQASTITDTAATAAEAMPAARAAAGLIGHGRNP